MKQYVEDVGGKSKKDVMYKIACLNKEEYDTLSRSQLYMVRYHFDLFEKLKIKDRRNKLERNVSKLNFYFNFDITEKDSFKALSYIYYLLDFNDHCDSVEVFPIDVWNIVTSYLGALDQLKMKTVCKTFNCINIGTEARFITHTINMKKTALANFINSIPIKKQNRLALSREPYIINCLGHLSCYGIHSKDIKEKGIVKKSFINEENEKRRSYLLHTGYTIIKKNHQLSRDNPVDFSYFVTQFDYNVKNKHKLYAHIVANKLDYKELTLDEIISVE